MVAVAPDVVLERGCEDARAWIVCTEVGDRRGRIHRELPPLRTHQRGTHHVRDVRRAARGHVGAQFVVAHEAQPGEVVVPRGPHRIGPSTSALHRRQLGRHGGCEHVADGLDQHHARTCDCREIARADVRRGEGMDPHLAQALVLTEDAHRLDRRGGIEIAEEQAHLHRGSPGRRDEHDQEAQRECAPRPLNREHRWSGRPSGDTRCRAVPPAPRASGP